MTGYVFDTEAVLAFLLGESGHEAVADRLDEVTAGETQGYLTEVNASEVLYRLARIKSDDGNATSESLRRVDLGVRGLTRHGLTIERASWQTTGEVKAAGRIALGDAHAVALAMDRDATLVVGADDDFDTLPVDVRCERFRDHSV